MQEGEKTDHKIIAFIFYLAFRCLPQYGIRIQALKHFQTMAAIYMMWYRFLTAFPNIVRTGMMNNELEDT